MNQPNLLSSARGNKTSLRHRRDLTRSMTPVKLSGVAIQRDRVILNTLCLVAQRKSHFLFVMPEELNKVNNKRRKKEAKDPSRDRKFHEKKAKRPRSKIKNARNAVRVTSEQMRVNMARRGRGCLSAPSKARDLQVLHEVAVPVHETPFTRPTKASDFVHTSQNRGGKRPLFSITL